jgi:hypothetical protein
MMKAVQLPAVGYRTSEKFAGREPLHELIREPDLHYVFNCVSRKRGAGLYHRFSDAQDRLKSEFGASISIVDSPGAGLKVAARFEFITNDKTIDEDLDFAVSRAGFRLTLRSMPILEGTFEERNEKIERTISPVTGCMLIKTNEKNKAGNPKFDHILLTSTQTLVFYEQKMLRVYAISEREYASADVVRAAESAEALYVLLDAKLKLPKLHQDLPDNVIPISSRSAPRPEMRSGVFEKDGTQVS